MNMVFGVLLASLLALPLMAGCSGEPENVEYANRFTYQQVSLPDIYANAYVMTDGRTGVQYLLLYYVCHDIDVVPLLDASGEVLVDDRG